MGKDAGKVSLSVLLLLLVSGRILSIQNSRKQESENTYIEWFLHTLGEEDDVCKQQSKLFNRLLRTVKSVI